MDSGFNSYQSMGETMADIQFHQFHYDYEDVRPPCPDRSLNGTTGPGSYNVTSEERIINLGRDSSLSFMNVSIQEKSALIQEFLRCRKIVKERYLLSRQEAEDDNELQKKIDQEIEEYYRTSLLLEEDQARIANSKISKDFMNSKSVLLLLKKENVFNVAAVFVEKLLFEVREKPDILAQVIQSQNGLAFLERVKKTLCSSFYEDLFSQKNSDYLLVLLLAKLYETKMEAFNVLLQAYLERQEYKDFIKMLFAPLYDLISQERDSLDPLNATLVLGVTLGQGKKQQEETMKKKFEKIQEYLNSFIESFIQNMNKMPVGIRLLCKVLIQRLPNAPVAEIPIAIILKNWIISNFTSVSNDLMKRNLQQVLNMFFDVISQKKFSRQEPKNFLNKYIQDTSRELIGSFLDMIQLTELPLDQTDLEQNQPTSICISLEEIGLLIQLLSAEKQAISNISPTVTRLVSRVEDLNADSNYSFFIAQKDPASMIACPPKRCFIVFQQRAQENPPYQIEAKSSLFDLCERFLLHSEDKRGLNSQNNNLTYEDILEAYQTPTRNPILQVMIKDRLNELDPSIPQADHFLRVLEDLTRRPVIQDPRIRLHLIKELDLFRHKNQELQEAHSKTKEILQKIILRNHLPQHIHLCISSPVFINHELGEKNYFKFFNPDHRRKVLLSENLNESEPCFHQGIEKFGMLPLLTGVQNQGGISSRYDSGTLEKFLDNFSNLVEVRDAMDSEDRFEINAAVQGFYTMMMQKVIDTSQADFGEDPNLILKDIEEYVSHEIYKRIYPVGQTVLDQRFWSKCRALQWVTPEDMRINSDDIPVEILGDLINMIGEIDSKRNSVEKLECVKEWLRYMQEILTFTSETQENQILEIMGYVLIRASPGRMHSNLNFIELLKRGDDSDLIKIECVVHFVSNIDHEFFGMTQEEFNQRR